MENISISEFKFDKLVVPWLSKGQWWKRRWEAHGQVNSFTIQLLCI